MTLTDAHTHIFAEAQVAERAALCARDSTFAELYRDPKAKLSTGTDLLSALDEAGFDRAVAVGFAFAGADDIAEQNACLLGVASSSQGRIIALATVNPALRGWEVAARDVLDRGARGFGELRPHNQGWDPLGTQAKALYRLAGEAGAVLLWHVSEPVGHAYPGKVGGIAPAELLEVATRYPALKLIAAHLGGGLPFFAQMPEVRAALENVWFDTAAGSLLYDEQSVARLIDLVGVERVLFGSDYPLLSPKRQFQRITALLPGDVTRAVCGGNAETLFG